MALRSPLIASTYGALDSDALADGRASDSQVLRTLAMGANRLVTRGQPLSSVVFNAIEESLASVSQPGWHKGYGHPGAWIQITPRLPITKRPLITAAKLIFRMAASAGTISVQVATDAQPFNPDARPYDSQNIFTFLGSDLDSPYTEYSDIKNNIPLREGPIEHVTYYLRSDLGPTGGLAADGATGTYGAPNSGVSGDIDDVERNRIVVGGTSWNAASDPDTWGKGGHALRFTTSVGTNITDPRWIIGSNDDTLFFFPPLPDDGTLLEELKQAAYEIKKIPMWRIYSLNLYAETVTP